jgi:hypothetical protein
MGLKIKSTIYVEPDLVQKIISDYVEKETGGSVDDGSFVFKIKTVSKGFGMGEYSETVFDGCRVDVS